MSSAGKILIGHGKYEMNLGGYIHAFRFRIGPVRTKITDLLDNNVSVTLGNKNISQAQQVTLEIIYKKGIAFELLELAIDTAYRRYKKIKSIKLQALKSDKLKRKKFGHEIIQKFRGEPDKVFEFLVEIGFIIPKTEIEADPDLDKKPPPPQKEEGDRGFVPDCERESTAQEKVSAGQQLRLLWKP